MATKKARHVIIRAAQAGCFAGVLESRNGDSVVLTNARRLWYWDGAASLSELAQFGTSRPKNCKFPPPVDRQEVLGVIEILDQTPQSIASIDGVPVWRA